MPELPHLNPVEAEEFFQLYKKANNQTGITPREARKLLVELRERLQKIRNIEPRPMPLVFDDFRRAVMDLFLERLRKEDQTLMSADFEQFWRDFRPSSLVKRDHERRRNIRHPGGKRGERLREEESKRNRAEQSAEPTEGDKKPTPEPGPSAPNPDPKLELPSVGDTPPEELPKIDPNINPVKRNP
jgi:hypothetical protein